MKTFTFFIALSIVCSCTLTGQILFQDDFSGDLSQWQIVTGTWSIEDGKLKGIGHGGNVDAWIYAGDTSWTDYEVSARVIFQSRGEWYSNAELVLRSTGHWQNEYRGCAFPYNWGPPGDGYNNRIETFYFADGEPIGTLRDTCYFDIPDTADIKVQVIGHRCAMYVNGKFAWGDENAPNISKGRIGLGVLWDLSVVFDDVVVRSLDTLRSIPRLSTDSISFGEVMMGSTATSDVIVHNDGTIPLIFDTLYIGKRGQSSNRDFTMLSECEIIQPGESCRVSITYHPTSYGAMENDGVIVFHGDCEFANFHVSANVVHDAYPNNVWTHIGLAGRSIKDIAAGNNALFAVTADSGSVYRLTDAGLSWNSVFSKGISSIANSPNGSVFIYRLGDYFLGTNNILFRSTNNGLSWMESLTDAYLDVIEAGPNGTIFSIGFNCGMYECSDMMYRSTDTGISWNSYPVSTIHQMVFLNYDHILATTSIGGYFYYATGFQVSVDDGLTWENIIEMPYVSSTALAVVTDDTILIGLQTPSNPNSDNNGLYYSSNLCTTRTKISEIVPNNILPLPDGKIIISTEGQGIFISTDVGDTWLSFNTGLTNINVHTLAMDSLGYVYAGTDSGVFTTYPTPKCISQTGWNLCSFPYSDEGKLRSEIYEHSTSDAFYFKAGYEPSDTLYHGKGYWVKCDYPDTQKTFSGHTSCDTIDVNVGWNIIGSICEPVTVSTIQSEPSGIVTSQFFGYNGNSYYETNTISPWKGYWVKVNQTGKLILSAAGKAIASNRIKIVASNEQPPPPPEGDKISNIEKRISNFKLEQNYPNPFNPVTNFQFSISPASGRDQLTILKVYDVLGREVATLVNEVKQPGEYTITWEAANVPSGIYFYRLTAGRYVETKKLILMK